MPPQGGGNQYRCAAKLRCRLLIDTYFCPVDPYPPAIATVHHRNALYAIAWLATVAAGLSATLFSVYLPGIVQELTGQTTLEGTSRIGSVAGAAYLLGWTLGGFLLGAIGDRLGRKVSFFASVLACSLGMAVTAFVDSLPLLVLCRMVTGAGAGGILLVTAVLVSEAWANGNRARVVGILINAFPMGFILVGAVHSAVADFRSAFAYGGLSVLLAVAVNFVVKESSMWERTRQRTATTVSIWEPRFRRDLVLSIVLFGSMLVGLWAAYTWMPMWVSSISAPADAQRNRAITVIMLGAGAVLGGIASGAVSNTIGRRRAAAAGYCGAFLLSYAVFVLPQQASIGLFLSTLGLSFCIGFNQGVLTGYIPELFPTLVRASAAGLSFNSGRLVTTVTVFLVGVLVEVLGGYERAIATFALAYLVGLVALFFARETKGQALPE